MNQKWTSTYLRTGFALFLCTGLLALAGAQSDDSGNATAPDEEKSEAGNPPDHIPPPPPPNITPPDLPPDRVPSPPVGKRMEGSLDDFDTPEAMELMRLERFLNMPRERLARMREAIEMVERMSDQEKTALLERIRDIKAMTMQRRREFFHHFQDLDGPRRKALMRIYYAFTPEERETLRTELKSREDPDGRKAYIDELIDEHRELLKIPPPPPRRNSQGPVQMQKHHRAPGDKQP